MDWAKVQRCQWGSSQQECCWFDSDTLTILCGGLHVRLAPSHLGKTRTWGSCRCDCECGRLFVSRCVDSDELATQGEQACCSLAYPSYVDLKITGTGFDHKCSEG